MLKNLNIRIEENDKQEFTNICKNVGISVSTAFNIFVKTVIKQKEIPFKLSVNYYDPFFNENNIKKLENLKFLDEQKKLNFIQKNLKNLKDLEK